MIAGEICIRFIDKTHKFKTISKSLNNIEYVEQLVYSVLEDEGIKPVCRTLFGLKLTNDNVWLAPNELVESLVNWSRKRRLNGEPKLEIRMRFRPSCLVRVSLLDPSAFEVIFAQINHDFMNTRFNDEKRDFVLLDDSVLGLVALNLVRHSVEQKISVEDILKQVKPKDFIPKRAAKWQSALLFRLAKQINLQETLRIGFEQCNNDTHRIKQKFVELFLLNVAPDYNSEIYDVQQIIRTNTDGIEPELRQIRVRYNQSQDEATCSIEIRSKIKLKNNSEKRYDSLAKWIEICDIRTISHTTLNENQIQIAGPGYELQKFHFNSSWHAKSFLSCIDGYHRLMRKWNFNLCREVSSPELKYLAAIGCHGPIGLETTKIKLSEHKQQSCYLVRKCMDDPNKFLIDTFIFDRVLLTMEVDWVEKRVFRLIGHATSLQELNVSVKTGQDAYSTLKALISDIEIRIKCDLKSTTPPMIRIHQLKCMIHPKENDFYPALLLSMSMKELKEQEDSDKHRKLESAQQLPIVLPDSSLNLTQKLYPVVSNGLCVNSASLNESQQVVTKDYEELSLNSLISEFTFHFCPKGHGHLELGRTLRPSQMRTADWMFIKSDLFAETIGYVITGTLVQEHFPLGRLDKFLRDNPDVDQLVKLSASFQLAQALLFLDERHIIHGKIRCHNIMLKQVHRIQVKLTDPLGAINIHRDQAFIPIEYFNSGIQLCVKKYYTGIDVWAAGTTMWQIFNNGRYPPPGRYANKLTQFLCPDRVWNLIERCWMVEANLRTSPQILHRDLFDLIAWDEGSHNYFYLHRPKNSNDNMDHDMPQTTNSSNSDLSTLDNIDSSILSSPNSTVSDNSNAILWRSRISSNHVQNYPTTWGSPRSGHLNRSKSINKFPNWTNLIKGASKQFLQSDLPPNQRQSSLSDIFGSQISLGSCPTPTGSEITRSTELMDPQSVSERLNMVISNPSDEWYVSCNRLKLGAEIGRGSSGVVIKGIMSMPDGGEEVVAVKTIDKECPDLKTATEDLRREFDISITLNHENIVKALGFNNESRMMVIFEYMPLGSLLSCVRNMTGHEDLLKLPLKKYAIDIAKGMEYIESKKIVHRDLALRNILLKNRHEVKICDFGLAQFLGADGHYELETERALPLKWYAPEALRSGKFTHKSDVWSYGVVLWEIYSCGNNPQYSGTYADLSETLKHERLPLPLGCPRDMYDLMLACWAYNPDDRKSFAEIRVMLE